MANKKVKISQLPESTSTEGLYVVGVNDEGSNVKVPLGDMLDKKISKPDTSVGVDKVPASDGQGDVTWKERSSAL